MYGELGIGACTSTFLDLHLYRLGTLGPIHRAFSTAQIRRNAKIPFIRWELVNFYRTESKLHLPREKHVYICTEYHGAIVKFGIEATKKMVLDNLWFPEVYKKVSFQFRRCDEV